MECQQAVLNASFGEPTGDVVGDLVEAASPGRDAKFVKRLEHG